MSKGKDFFRDSTGLRKKVYYLINLKQKSLHLNYFSQLFNFTNTVFFQNRILSEFNGHLTKNSNSFEICSHKKSPENRKKHTEREGRDHEKIVGGGGGGWENGGCSEGSIVASASGLPESAHTLGPPSSSTHFILSSISLFLFFVSVSYGTKRRKEKRSVCRWQKKKREE